MQTIDQRARIRFCRGSDLSSPHFDIASRLPVVSLFIRVWIARSLHVKVNPFLFSSIIIQFRFHAGDTKTLGFCAIQLQRELHKAIQYHRPLYLEPVQRPCCIIWKIGLVTYFGIILGMPKHTPWSFLLNGTSRPNTLGRGDSIKANCDSKINMLT